MSASRCKKRKTAKRKMVVELNNSCDREEKGNDIGTFFLKAKQWSDVADFEQRELQKLRVFTSLKQTSTLLFMIAVVNI